MGPFAALLGVIASPHTGVSSSTLGVAVPVSALMGVPARTLGVGVFASSVMDANSCTLMLDAGVGTALPARALGSWLGSLGSCTATPMQHDKRR